MPTSVGSPTSVGPPAGVGPPTVGVGPVPRDACGNAIAETTSNAADASCTASPRDACRNAVAETVRELARNASVEVLPGQIQAVDLKTCLPPGTAVYVPCLPGAAWQETVAACRRLRLASMCPVPHLTARSVRDASDLRARLTQLAEVGVDRLLLVAGDADRPAGRYRDTLDVLESGLLVEHGFDRLGVAAHPEGHPLVERADLERAMTRKVEYAAAEGASMWMVTQFGFAPTATAAWLRCLGARFPLGVRVGLAGPTRLSTLVGFAAKCGVRTTARVVTRRPGALRLMGRYVPDDFVRDLARHAVEAPESPLRGIHLFGFGGIRATSRWLRAVAGECEPIGHRAPRSMQQFPPGLRPSQNPPRSDG